MPESCRKSQGTLYWLALSIESVEEERKKREEERAEEIFIWSE
jgi:hypothetical protein